MERTADVSAEDLLAEVDSVSSELEGAEALEILAWTFARFGDGVVVTSSFQDSVLVDLAVQVEPRAHIVFLDTGFHFPETLAYLHHIEARYDLNLEILKPSFGLDISPCGSADCCQRRKVEPLNAFLSTKSAWVTGLKRVDTPERKDTPIASLDIARQIVKVNPIATWTEDDVEAYVQSRDLPRHPLNYVGYFSIGCAPTTRPVAEGEDPRAGRWPDSDKTECGLHL